LTYPYRDRNHLDVSALVEASAETLEVEVAVEILLEVENRAVVEVGCFLAPEVVE